MLKQPFPNRPPPPKPLNPAITPLWMAGLLALAALLAYSNSFSGTFAFDDAESITGNASITHLWPLSGPLSPPASLTVGGRPLYNFTLALSYALSGMNVWGYHAVNLLIHVLAGLVLLGVARLTLLQPPLRGRFGEDAPLLAFAIALLWLLHPVQTGCVTYISQRSESQMGLFYLLTLYSFIRTTETPARPGPWPVVAVIACILGMLTKEVMVTAPILVLIYDRTFVAGTFRDAWRQRWRLHAALFATWLLLLPAFLNSGQRPIGLGRGVSSWDYALTQCHAIVHYLALAAWPHPLVLDYGADIVTNPFAVLPQALVLLALLAATAIAFIRWPALGFAGAWFFLILAPTSSFIPVPKAPVGDNRLYLPLAALVALLVLGLHAGLGKKSRFVFIALAIVWGTLTFLRNDDFQTKTGLWRQTIEACPNNAQAYCDYGEALVEAGHNAEAVAAFGKALQLRPDYPEAQVNLGFALVQLQQPMEAITHYREALRLRPGFSDAENNWGNALAQMGQYAEAIPHYLEAIRFTPDFAVAHYNCGNMYLKLGRLPEGFAQYEEALRYKPDFPEVRYNWGNVLLNHHQPAEAIPQYREAIRLKPRWAEAHNNLGMALFDTGDPRGALAEFQTALQIDPTYAPATQNILRLQAPPPPNAK